MGTDNHFRLVHAGDLHVFFLESHNILKGDLLCPQLAGNNRHVVENRLDIGGVIAFEHGGRDDNNTFADVLCDLFWIATDRHSGILLKKLT